MTTVAQVKQAVKLLLERNPDLALVGRLAVVKPVHHILRGIYIDRSSDPLEFVPTWSVIVMCESHRAFSYKWGGRVYGPPGGWNINDPGLPVSMCEAIEREALLPMRSIGTIDDFVKFTSKERFPDTYLDLYEIRKIFVDIARGDLQSAGSICDYMKTDRARRWHLPDMQERYDRVTKELCPLITANDRGGLARLLHKYEEGSARALKLEKYWEPTPFPIEMQ